jgi:DNA-binding CsgD family transcriptional regulator
MYGRSEELRVIDAVLSGLGMSGRALVEVTGDPGIDKTTLLAQTADLAARHGFAVMWGRGDESERHSPFFMIVDAVTDHLVEAALVDRLGGESPYVATLLTAFPDVRCGAGTPLPFVKASRHCLFRAARELVERLLSDRGLVLILDDVHWADEYSIGWLDFLHLHPSRAPVGVVFAYRPRQAPARLASVTSRVTFRSAVLSVPLRPLRRSDVERLTGQRPGNGDLYDRSGGNPFYAQLYAHTAQRLGGRLPDDVDARPDGPRAQVIRDEVSRVSAIAAAVAEAASMVAEPISVPLVAAVAALTEAEVEEGLEDLLWRDIMRRDGGTVRFRHALVRAVVGTGMSARQRRVALERAASARTDCVAAARPRADLGPPMWQSLTARERQIARSVGEGLTNKQIARRLGVSDKTIEAHLARVFAKLGVASRVAVASLVAKESEL